MSIEEILKLDKKITFRKLVYSKYKFTWAFIGISLLVIGISLILYWILSNFDLKKIWSLVLGIIPSFIAGRYLLKKNTQIIKKHYKHSLLENGNWNYISLIKIRKKIIKKELKGKINLSNENLLFIIDSLKKESEILKYNYSLLINGVVIILSVYIGAFLGGFGNYAKDMNDYIGAYKIIAGISFLIISLLVYMELVVFKEFITSRKRNKYRLIRVFENLYLEQNAT